MGFKALSLMSLPLLLTKNKWNFVFLTCRDKFVNYIGDLVKHKKQLEDVNNQLVEDLQGLSKMFCCQ